jgi:hypothetical protein
MKGALILVSLVVLLMSFVGCSSDSTAPTIAGVAASGITTSGATITWTTDEPASSQVEYGLTTAYGSATSLDKDKLTSHSITLSELQPSTAYHYRVVSIDKAGNQATSDPDADWTFTTRTQFTLTGSQVAGDSNSAALRVRFTATGPIALRLTGPDGAGVGSAYAEKGVTTVLLDMAGYGESPSPGTYTLIVEESGDVQIATSTFNFVGGSASVSEVTLTWSWSTWSLDYTLEGISFKVNTTGDLPVCTYEGEVSIDGQTEALYPSQVVLPGEQKTITDTLYISGISSGQHPLTLTIKDSQDKVVCSYSGTVTPS